MSTPTENPTPEFLAENSGPRLQNTAIAFIVLLFLFAGLRWLSQHTKGRPFGLGDLFSYIGMGCIVGECILALVQVPVAGVGRHVEYLKAAAPQKLAHAYIIMFPIELLYISAFTFPKLSILWMYLSIFTNSITRNITYGLVAIIVATWTAETLSAIFQCWPVAYIWNKSLHGHCVNQNALFQYWSVPNIVTDLVMLVVPMPTIWHLQMSRVQKIGLMCTFALGSIGLIASVIRFAIFTKTAALVDATWASVSLQIWTIVEPSMYFFAGILPTLRPLLSLWFSKIRTRAGTLVSKPYGSGPGSGRSRSRNEGNHHASGSDKWESLGDHPGDNLELVEYDQHIVGGRIRGVDVAEGEEEANAGIMKTSEITVTRETV